MGLTLQPQQVHPSRAPVGPRTSQGSGSGTPGIAATSGGGCEPSSKYDSVSTIWNEWHGIPPHSGPEGGIIAQETSHKKAWRSHWDAGVKKRFSRMKLIVQSSQSRRKWSMYQLNRFLKSSIKCFKIRQSHCTSLKCTLIRKMVESRLLK